MFKRFWWRWQYDRFQNRWYSIADAYLSSVFFNDLKTLIKKIPEEHFQSYYRPDYIISSQYENILSWSKDAETILIGLKYQKIGLRPIKVKKQYTLNDFLVSNDGRGVRYDSALQEVLYRLTLLHQRIGDFSKEDQRYYYSQIKELFETGIALLFTLLNGYALK